MKLKKIDWRVKIVDNTFDYLPETKIGFYIALFFSVLFLIFLWPSYFGLSRKKYESDSARMLLIFLVHVLCLFLGVGSMSLMFPGFPDTTFGAVVSYIVGTQLYCVLVLLFHVIKKIYLYLKANPINWEKITYED